MITSSIQSKPFQERVRLAIYSITGEWAAVVKSNGAYELSTFTVSTGTLDNIHAYLNAGGRADRANKRVRVVSQ